MAFFIISILVVWYKGRLRGFPGMSNAGIKALSLSSPCSKTLRLVLEYPKYFNLDQGFISSLFLMLDLNGEQLKYRFESQDRSVLAQQQEIIKLLKEYKILVPDETVDSEMGDQVVPWKITLKEYNDDV